MTYVSVAAPRPIASIRAPLTTGFRAVNSESRAPTANSPSPLSTSASQIAPLPYSSTNGTIGTAAPSE